MPEDDLSAYIGSDPKQKELVVGVLRALERRPLTLADLRYVVAPPSDLDTGNGSITVEPVVDELFKTGYLTTADKGIFTYFLPARNKESHLNDETPLTLTPKANLWLSSPFPVSGHYHTIG
jgi:hypothetical protein